MALVIVAGSICITNAATTKNITSVSMPSSMTVAVGESKPLNITINPSDTTNVVNVHWCSSMSNYVKATNCKFGSYWDQPASCNVKGIAKGKGAIIASVLVYDKKDGKQIKEYKLTCNVTITDAKSGGTANTPVTPAPKPQPVPQPVVQPVY